MQNVPSERENRVEELRSHSLGFINALDNYVGLLSSLIYLHICYIFSMLTVSQFCCSEQSIISARASVMVYDDNQKKWVPSGSSSGLSKVQIYHHQQNNTFRVVGRKLQDHEVVINCSILKGLKYNQATATFHQWRDSKYVYGLNFSSQSDAENFARAMMHALEVSVGFASDYHILISLLFCT